VAHYSLQLGIAESVASHRYELLRPQLNKLAYLSRGNDYPTDKRELIILEEVVLLENFARKDFRIVLDNTCSVLSRLTNRAISHIYGVRIKHDALAKEMCQHIVDADKLHVPLQQLQNVSLLLNKLVVGVGNSNEVEELIDAWVCFFKVLG
jgi:hypothetical protein